MFENYAGEHKTLRLLVGTDHADFRNDIDLDFAYRFLLSVEDGVNAEYRKTLELKNARFRKSKFGETTPVKLVVPANHEILACRPQPFIPRSQKKIKIRRGHCRGRLAV